MDLKSEEKRRADFRNILFSLARNQNMFQNSSDRYDIYKQLEELYYIDADTPFRHYYSDIFSILTQIKADASSGDINILGQNLNLIRKGYQAQNTDKDGKLIDIGDNIKKLYDHVSLDIARISYSAAQDRETLGEDNIRDLQSRINTLEAKIPEIQQTQEKLGNLKNELDETQKNLSNSQKEYIAILGIFSAVVLAFTGGIAFSTSVLENIHHSSIYRTVFVCCLIGLILIDVIFLMFRYIEKIVHNSEEKYKLKQYIPIIVVNIVILVVMAVTVVAWNTGWVEQRNQEITKTISSSQASNT